MIVLDASAAVEFLLRTPAAPAVDLWLFAAGQTIHAPHLIDIEVAHVIRRYVAKGDIGAALGHAALSDMTDLPIRRHAHDFLLNRIWELRNSISAYDAAYVALAETLNATLITRDARLARTRGHSAQIEFVSV